MLLHQTTTTSRQSCAWMPAEVDEISFWISFTNQQGGWRWAEVQCITLLHSVAVSVPSPSTALQTKHLQCRTCVFYLHSSPFLSPLSWGNDSMLRRKTDEELREQRNENNQNSGGLIQLRRISSSIRFAGVATIESTASYERLHQLCQTSLSDDKLFLISIKKNKQKKTFQPEAGPTISVPVWASC